MQFDSLVIAAVIAFFGVFAVTLFTVSVWSNLPAKAPPRPSPVPARRPTAAASQVLDPRQA